MAAIGAGLTTAAAATGSAAGIEEEQATSLAQSALNAEQVKDKLLKDANDNCKDLA